MGNWARHLILIVAILALVGCAAPSPMPTSVPASAPTAQPGAAAAEPTKPTAAAPQPAATAIKPIATAAAQRVEVLRLPGGDFGAATPYSYSRGPGYCRMSFIFDTLVWKDSSGEQIPWLAESWQHSEDGLIWTISLRDGVKWHDGKPLTADDVVFTFEYFKKYPNPWAQAAVDMVKGTEKADARTVRITLSRPYAPFLRNVLGAMPIIPKHVWEKVEEPTKFTAKEAWIGSGPYRLVSYGKAEGTYLFEANDDFWLGPPYVKRIELVPVADESLALKLGNVHAGSIAGIMSPTSAELVKWFKENQKYTIITAPGEWNLVLYFNFDKGAPFTDKAFRQAVAYALDLPKMVDQVLFGEGKPGIPGRLPVSNPWSNPRTPTYPYDVAKAKHMLESAGYVDRNGDGVREGPAGRPLRIQLAYSGELSSPRPAEMIKAWLGEVGIEVALKAVDRKTLDQITTDGQYEMAITGYGGLAGDPDFLRTTYSRTIKAKRFTRVYGYSNDRFEELAAKQIQTVDQTARRKAIDEMQQILGEDVAAIPLYYPDSNYVFDTSVFDAWYYTPGGIGSGVPMTWNKHALVTGEKTGLKIRGR